MREDAVLEHDPETHTGAPTRDRPLDALAGLVEPVFQRDVAAAHQAVLARFQRFLDTWKRRADRAELDGLPMPDEMRMRLFANGLSERLRALQASVEGAMAAARAKALAAEATPAVAEARAQAVEVALRKPTHEALFNLLSASPFVDRTRNKPLGIPGDFGMVEQLDGDPFDADTRFGRMVNAFFVGAPVAQAHRNRLRMLAEDYEDLAAAAADAGVQKRVLVIGCGPAADVRRFAKQSRRPQALDFTFVDKSAEALRYVADKLMELRDARADGQGPSFRTLRDNALLIAKGRGRLLELAAEEGERFDLVVIAGLGDYLDDACCAGLIERVAGLATPDGRIVFTNVHRANPDAFHMAHLLAWPLIYRDHAAMLDLSPEGKTCEIGTDATGLNLFLTVHC